MYDVAVSTACPSLNDIVVDSIATGQACIAHLRKHNLGRARFICLDKLRKYDTVQLSTPDNVPRLFDLIRVKDPKFVNAFYHVLQNTLVANDMTHANRIAYGTKRWRVVTLEGQVIDLSGTMSGGGGKPQRGGMSSKFAAADNVRQEDVVRLERSTGDVENELRALMEKKKELLSLLEEASSATPKIDLELSKFEMDVKSVEKQIADTQLHVSEFRYC